MYPGCNGYHGQADHGSQQHQTSQLLTDGNAHLHHSSDTRAPVSVAHKVVKEKRQRAREVTRMRGRWRVSVSRRASATAELSDAEDDVVVKPD